MNSNTTEDASSSNVISAQSGPTSIAFRYNESRPGGDASRSDRQSRRKSQAAPKQELDFIGPSTSIKELFSMPYSNDSGVAVAVHNMGDGTLLLDGGVFPQNGNGNHRNSTDSTYPTSTGSNGTGARDVASMQNGKSRRRYVRPRSSISGLSSTHQDQMQVFHESQFLGNESSMAMIASILQRHQKSYSLPQSETTSHIPTRTYSPADSNDMTSLMAESSDGSKVSMSTCNTPSFGDAGNTNQMILPKPEDYTSDVVTYPENPRQFLPWNFGDYNMLLASDALVVKSEGPSGDGAEECVNCDTFVTVSDVSNASYHISTDKRGLTLRLAESSDLRRQFDQYADHSNRSDSSNADNFQSYAEAVATSRKEGKGYDNNQEENEGTVQNGNNNILLPPSENFNLAFNLQTCIIPSPRFQSNFCGYQLFETDQSPFVGNDVTSSPVCTVLDAYLDSEFVCF